MTLPTTPATPNSLMHQLKLRRPSSKKNLTRHAESHLKLVSQKEENVDQK